MSLDDLWGPDPRIARLQRDLARTRDERQQAEIRSALDDIAEEQAMARSNR